MSLAAFRRAVESHDIDAALELLAPDVLFRSPVVFKPYQGRDAVAVILRAVVEVFEDFGYDAVVESGERAVLMFHARVGEKTVEGADFLHFGVDGLVDEFVVMIRPMSGVLALAEAMRAKLEAAGAI